MLNRGLAATVLVFAIYGVAHAGAAEFFSETAKDFGTTPKGPILLHQFTIKNTTKNTITMGTPRIQCGCVSATLMNPTLKPGESTTLVCYMDTRKIPAQQLRTTKTVAVYVPFPTLGEEVTVKVTCVARDDIFMSTDELTFGSVHKGESPTASVKLTMFTQPAWEITEAKCTGAYTNSSFKLLKREGAEVTYEISAKLEAECPAGNWTCDIWLKTNVQGLEKLRVPVTVTVLPNFKAQALDFGDVPMGQAIERQLKLESAESAFKVLGVKGNDSVKVTTITDGARAVHLFKVSLDPKKAGKLNEKVEILTDNKHEPKLIVPVSALVK